MKIAYFDCFSGASGDMILGALLDAGLSIERLRKDLGRLGLGGLYDLQVERALKKGISGSRIVITLEDEDEHGHGEASPHHRHLKDIEEILNRSSLSGDIKERSLKIFTRLAEAEARVHNTTIDEIHFHEVGALDSIIDIIGSVIGISSLGIEKIYCSPLHVGTGTVKCSHGVLPVPAPATLELIKGVPVYSTGVKGELLTPTGAAVLTTLSSGFIPMPPMVIEKTGYGSGTKDLEIPNMLRLVIGESVEIDKLA